MILAHLVGDFILQTDRLAYWKSQELRGVLVHGLIVSGITAMFALPFQPFWWQGVLFIGMTHTAVDAAQWYFKPRMAPLLRFFLDQFLHFLFMFLALAAGDYLNLAVQDSVPLTRGQLILLYALGYAFLTMPTWVLLKFVGAAVVNKSAPVFPDSFNKWAGIAERVLILTFVLTGQFLLVPLLAVPRLILERKQLAGHAQRRLYMFESVAGIALAIGVGLLLRAV